jgi:hypothetical protein
MILIQRRHSTCQNIDSQMRMILICVTVPLNENHSHLDSHLQVIMSLIRRAKGHGGGKYIVYTPLTNFLNLKFVNPQVNLPNKSYKKYKRSYIWHTAEQYPLHPFSCKAFSEIKVVQERL